VAITSWSAWSKRGWRTPTACKSPRPTSEPVDVLLLRVAEVDLVAVPPLLCHPAGPWIDSEDLSFDAVAPGNRIPVVPGNGCPIPGR
jgi:hypothetical protein